MNEMTNIRTYPFRNSASQYRANNSGDFVVLPAVCVTALLLINLPQAYDNHSDD